MKSILFQETYVFKFCERFTDDTLKILKKINVVDNRPVQNKRVKHYPNHVRENDYPLTVQNPIIKLHNRDEQVRCPRDDRHACRVLLNVAFCQLRNRHDRTEQTCRHDKLIHPLLCLLRMRVLL